ncbi:MAG: hypothetical protein IK095_10185 [Oscillospiraceae bacterium]|nr:hypothetical protein [Oscillospiraceae bacterium]
MSTLEDKLDRKLRDEAQQKRLQQQAQQSREAAQARLREEHRAKFSAAVTEAVGEFPRLARKYGTAIIEIEIITAGFLGLGKRHREWKKVWALPSGIFLSPGGSFYRYDHYVTSTYGARPGTIHEELIREEAIGRICDGCKMPEGSQSPQAVRDYVQDLFVACLSKHK